MLEALLDDGVHDDAEYGDGLSNHLPMALVALHQLGATDPRLQAFAAAYRTRLGSAPPAADWPAGDAWQSRFGDPAAWPAYRSLFAQWLLHEGPQAVLAQALAPLMKGCGAAAFHGLIRTANAVTVGHTGELADALAYWACRHLPLSFAPAGNAATDPAAVLSAIVKAQAGWRSQRRLIVERMHEASVQRPFMRHAGRLRVGPDSLASLARLAARWYAGSGDFTALHLVTASHAVRRLLPFLDQPLAALQDFWIAYAAGAASIEPAVWARSAPPQAGAGPTWEAIAARAITSDDEHAIKLVYSCREEAAHYGDDGLQRAAARAVVAA